MSKTPNNQQQAGKSIFTLLAAGFLIFGLSSPAFSAPNRSEIVIFQEAESNFSDSDALGAYGDENDEYLSADDTQEENKTTETDTSTDSSTKTMTASSVDKKSNERNKSAGYGDTDREDGA